LGKGGTERAARGVWWRWQQNRKALTIKAEKRKVQTLDWNTENGEGSGEK